MPIVLSGLRGVGKTTIARGWRVRWWLFICASIQSGRHNLFDHENFNSSVLNERSAVAMRDVDVDKVF
jgi:hypothetical protein